MASGLSFGVAVAVGGIASPLLGVLGDGVGLVPSFGFWWRARPLAWCFPSACLLTSPASAA